MSRFLQSVGNFSKRLVHNINSTNVKRALAVANDFLGVIDKISPILVQKSDLASEPLKSPAYNKLRLGIRVTDNLLNRGGVFSDKSNEIIQPVASKRREAKTFP